ncbi:MAG TPA: hypothetical protein VE269_03825, partial [Gaiellaceae bacterium]|nr:hypothetical protein [Gaiellaceae bacterium]
TGSVPKAAAHTRRTSTFGCRRSGFARNYSRGYCATRVSNATIAPSFASTLEVVMSSQRDERVMISERLAPGMLPRVLNSFDMTIIFVAIVLFIVNAGGVQPAGQAAFTYWIVAFLAFLIPGALITAQLGQMFPQEGSLYV